MKNKKLVIELQKLRKQISESIAQAESMFLAEVIESLEKALGEVERALREESGQ